MFENVVYPEVPALLDELRSRDCRLLVTTSKPKVFAVAILEHFELHHYFEAIFGSNLDGSLADKHDLLSHVRQQTAFEPASTALVGDRKFDITAARASGVLAVGALWGYGSRSELEEAGADHLAESPKSVSDLVAAWQEHGGVKGS
jgi:phosphoglycolate phosphatase